MKTLLSFCAMFLMVATLGFAADIDGKWVEERKFTPPNGGEERTITTTFELKADGATLTGKMKRRRTPNVARRRRTCSSARSQPSCCPR